MQNFVYGEDFCSFIEEPTGSEIRLYHPGNFFSISCVAIAVENLTRRRKIATRRLISRIILASVVNASSRRRRGLAKYIFIKEPRIFLFPDWVVKCCAIFADVVVVHDIAVTLRITSFRIGAMISRSEFMFREQNFNMTTVRTKAKVHSVRHETVLSRTEFRLSLTAASAAVGCTACCLWT